MLLSYMSISSFNGGIHIYNNFINWVHNLRLLHRNHLNVWYCITLIRVRDYMSACILVKKIELVSSVCNWSYDNNGYICTWTHDNFHTFHSTWSSPLFCKIGRIFAYKHLPRQWLIMETQPLSSHVAAFCHFNAVFVFISFPLWHTTNR